MNLFRIEYLIDGQDTTWKANILAKDQKDALSFLRRIIKRPCKINYISNDGPVHAITDEVKKVFSIVKEKEVIKEVPKEIIKEVEVEKEVIKEVPKEIIKEVEVEKEVIKEVEVFKCPYCEKTYKTGKTLISHIDKFHSIDKFHPEEE
jgi:hypothetical protein